MQAFRHGDDAKGNSSTFKMSLEDFLGAIRRAKRLASEQMLREWQEQAASERHPEEERYRVVHADCREHRCPKDIPLIATDSSWTDLD